MKPYSRSIGLLGILPAVQALAGIPDSPQQVQPLSAGARAPIFAAGTTDGALRTFAPDSYKKPTANGALTDLGTAGSLPAAAGLNGIAAN